MKNFDLHTHVSLKVMLGGHSNNNRKDCWKEVRSKFIDALTGGAINSQSSFNQMQKGEVSVAIAILYSLEYAFTKNFLLKKVLPKIEKDISKKYLTNIESYNVSPYENIKDELELIKKSLNKNIKIINDVNDINDENTIHLVLSIEGLHSFLDSYKYNINEFDTVIKKLQENFLEFIKLNRVLYVGLTHLTKNDICTHTYAMKLIRDEAFIPGGEGLTTYAKNFIDLCYQNNGYNNKRTLIDIKHMGLSSRIQFYKYRSEKGYTNIPLVASHIAVTGLSFNNIYISGASKSKDYKDTIEVHHRPLNSVFSYSRDGAPKVDLSFNQWSLNLYDEEIIYIINSEGIMGLIMDSRVLGNSVDVNNKVIAEGVEYFSKESFNYLLNNNHFNKKAPKNYDKEIELEFKGIPYDGLIHLFANMMHIVMVYYKKYSNTEDKLKAWDHICIGSDFDGLISTIGGADDASYFNNLRKEFSKMISTIRKNSKMSQYFGALDSDVLVNKIFYSNGIRFLNKNL